MKKEIKQFIEEYTEELVSGNAAYFVGSGISVDSQLPDWSGLIKPFTDRLGILDLTGKDMPLMAQYVVNEDVGNRGPFINNISRKLRKNFSLNRYHESIARTNLQTIWTTNYDNLLEKAYASTTIDVKFNDESIARDVPDSQVEIIKMHGCIFNSNRNDIVITQADYEDFFINRPATAQRLRLDLLQKSFLFIGYGYGDPNIKNIITEARRLAGANTRRHYLIIKDKKENREFDLWCNNLRRYGISVIRIPNHEDLRPILEELSLKSRGKTVFITGSHETTSDQIAGQLGRALALKDGLVFNDGQSSGLMRFASRSYMETIIENKGDINKRMRFFPNPYAANASFANDTSLLPILKQWRAPLFRATHIIVAFDGGMGTKAEIEVALDMGSIVIPVFTDEAKDTWSMLDSVVIKERLSGYDPQYMSKLKKKDIMLADILELIRKILS